MVKHPNADNIVQLTKIFNVSANFLLNDHINISIDPVLENSEDMIQALLEKELKDDNNYFALKARAQKSQKSTWIPIIFSGIIFLMIVTIYISS